MMQNYDCGCMQMMGMPGQCPPMAAMPEMMGMPGQCPPMAAMPGQYFPMAAMPEQQLEAMYPKTYYIIQPVVENACDMMMTPYGQMYTPTHEHIESMIDDVYGRVESDVENAIKQSPREEERQFIGGGRRILRDFIGALLIASLIRRRRPFFGHPGYYGGGYGFYGGYPIY